VLGLELAHQDRVEPSAILLWLWIAERPRRGAPPRSEVHADEVTYGQPCRRRVWPASALTLSPGDRPRHCLGLGVEPSTLRNQAPPCLDANLGGNLSPRGVTDAMVISGATCFSVL
jgi:hypothetical protein